MGHPKVTSGSAMAEGPRDALVSRNSTSTKYPYRMALFAILRLADFTQYRSVTDTQTQRRTDRYTTTACTALASVSYTHLTLPTILRV